MRGWTTRIGSTLGQYRQFLAAAITAVLILDVMVAVKPDVLRASAPGQDRGPSLIGNGAPGPGSSALPSASATARPGKSGIPPVSKLAKYKPGGYVEGVGTIPFGIDFVNRKIKLVYYWKGDRSNAVNYLGGSGHESALDESTAFWRFAQYINRHANDPVTRSCTTANTTCFMGYPFNLHGFTIDTDCIRKTGQNKWGPCVVQAGEDPNGWTTAVTTVKQQSPFAAISSHGGLSDYACPLLAREHIFNPVTYNLYGGLVAKTKGWCLPASMSWEKQVQLTLAWLKRQNTTQYCTAGAVGCTKRVYGILFAEYDGLHGAVDKFVKQLVDAGVNLGKSKSAGGYSVYSVSTSLSTAATQQGDVVTKFVNDGVNTIIAPDSGAEITFTHAAEGQQYYPDYYVWPCSGEDATGQVRLYDPHQWTRARGLSCYDENWNLDLTLDDNARETQWFRQFQEIACPSGSSSCADPPATGPMVYQGLLPVLVGLTTAGPDVTMEKVFAGIDAFREYRYNAIEGPKAPSADPSHFLLTLGSSDGSQIGDVAEVSWNGTTRTSGNTTPGAYIYSDVRYKPGANFS